MIARPSENEYASYYSNYISLISESDILSVLTMQIEEIAHLVKSVKPEQETYRYAPNKWSIREVLGHMIDCERVFGYRAFCISRGETTPLPSFDDNVYVVQSNYNTRKLQDIIIEFSIVRKSNLEFLCQLNDKEWIRLGTASNNPVSVRALSFIMAGHVRHHINVLHGSYEVSAGA
jgi:hypothetical protein